MLDWHARGRLLVPLSPNEDKYDPMRAAPPRKPPAGDPPAVPGAPPPNPESDIPF